MRSDRQTLEIAKEYIDMGASIRDLIEADFFKNQLHYPEVSKTVYKTCEHCGSKYNDEKAILKRDELRKAYAAEENRLIVLFKDVLCYYPKLTQRMKKLKKHSILHGNTGIAVATVKFHIILKTL
jgi:hypothetical protein